MRLIDADALNLEYEVDMADDWKTAHEMANIVKYALTIDAVPVIRCKDCVFWDTIPFKQRRGYCKKYDHYAKGKEYCAWGENETD